MGHGPHAVLRARLQALGHSPVVQNYAETATGRRWERQDRPRWAHPPVRPAEVAGAELGVRPARSGAGTPAPFCLGLCLGAGLGGPSCSEAWALPRGISRCPGGQSSRQELGAAGLVREGLYPRAGPPQHQQSPWGL